MEEIHDSCGYYECKTITSLHVQITGEAAKVDKKNVIYGSVIHSHVWS